MTYPFGAVVGMDDMRLALLLNAVSPAVGGVLVRGEKGTAKSTTVRALAAVLPPVDVVTGCRFACDPVAPDPGCPDGPHDRGAPGLIRPARLVDLPLDAAAMGTAYVEREGVSVRHAARFLLVGTMNPEEGELRPQLLDRFGLTVEVAAPRDRARLPHVVLSDDALRQVTAVCAAFDVDGLRADLVTARAAIAHAAWSGRDEVTEDDVRVAARLALPHRRRRNPFDAPGLDEDTLDQALEDARPEDDGPD